MQCGSWRCWEHGPLCLSLLVAEGQVWPQRCPSPRAHPRSLALSPTRRGGGREGAAGGARGGARGLARPRASGRAPALPGPCLRPLWPLRPGHLPEPGRPAARPPAPWTP